MAKISEEEFEALLSRRINADPRFKKAKAILNQLMAKSPRPHLTEERIRILDGVIDRLDQYDAMNLASRRVSLRTDHAYDDLPADYPKKKRPKPEPPEVVGHALGRSRRPIPS